MVRKHGYPYPIPYDLSNCDQEPLRFIATVQAHAALLVCSADELKVLQATDNCLEKLGMAHEEILQKQLSEVLPPAAWETFEAALALGEAYLANNPIRVGIQSKDGMKWFNCLPHFQDKQLLLEFEPFEAATLDVALQNRIGRAIQHIQQQDGLERVLDATAREIKHITGYDRVMIYRFAKNGSGQVVAEARENHLEAFLDLHYPASDIPPQARALYLKNPVRIISSVQAEPAALVPPLHPLTQQPSNLGPVIGRGVSPVHLEYLSNMGVRATMSIAIVFEGKLWGLVACHHYATDKFTGFLRRNTTLLLSRIISGHISLQVAHDFRRSSLEANIVKSRLFEQMSTDWNLLNGLTQGKNTLLDLNSSSGAALLHDERLTLLGTTPDEEQVQLLIEWVKGQDNAPLFHTDELPRLYPPAEAFKEKAAGLLAVRLSSAPDEYVLWFKPEVLKTVNWGGNPEKALTGTAGSQRLSPRKSFEKWAQEVANTSHPWEQYEIDTAMALRSDVKDFIFQKYKEAKDFNRELSEAYVQLESFSYSVSHDLRAPLRSINGFANVLKEDYGHQLDEEGNYLIDTIIGSANRLSHFIDDILAYSRTSNSELQPVELSLQSLAQEAADDLFVLKKHSKNEVQLHIRPDLPNVVADRTMLRQLISNVMSNAFKYSQYSKPPVVEVGGSQDAGCVHFFIKDNGIGFDTRYTEKIFGVFNRLVNDEDFEGTGVGMAIVKRIAEKHQARIEVESEPGKGSTFHFHFPARGLKNDKNK